MFDFLRRSASSPVAKVFLAVIIIVFVFWGVGVFTVGNRNLIAKVNGIPITLQDYENYYNFELFKLKQTLGEVSQEELKKLNIKQRVLNDLIRLKLINQKAKELGIKVSPEEVNYAIAQIPSFQVNGRFDYQRFLAVLQDVGVSPRFFKFLMKSDLLLQKLKLYLTSPVILSKKEVEDYINFNKQNILITEGVLPLKACEAKVVITEKKLKSYYLAHRDLYKSPEKVKLYYLFLPFKAKVKVTDKEVEKFYLSHIVQFKQPLQFKIVVIQAPYSEKGALKKAESLRTKLKSIKDFSKYGGKEVGWVGIDAFPPELKQVLEKAKPGMILGPIKGANGYLILGIKEVRGGKVLPLKKVKKEIYNYLVQKKIREKVKSLADDIYTQVIAANGLKNWAKKNKKKLKVTPWLTQQDLIKMFQDLELAKKILSASKGEYFAPVFTDKGIYLLELADKKPSKLLSFSEVKERVKRDYLKDEGKKVCEGIALKVFSEYKKNKDFEKVLQKNGFRVDVFSVKRYQLSQKFPLPIAQAIDSKIPPGLIEQPFWNEDSLEVFLVKKIEPFKGTITSEEIKSLTPVLLRQKRTRWFNKWFQTLIMSSQVKIYPLFKRL